MLTAEQWQRIGHLGAAGQSETRDSRRAAHPLHPNWKAGGAYVEEIDWDRFTSGIYNYCDRWCERCPHTARCCLYHQEQKTLERHLLRGEDPDDIKVVLADVHRSFQETIELVMKAAEEMGIDLSECEAAPTPELDYHEHPFYRPVNAWGDRVEALIERLTAEVPDVAEEVVIEAVRDGLTDDEPLRRSFAAVRDHVELLVQYRYFIPAKTARAVGMFCEGDCSEHARDDALGTAKLIHECLGKMITALWSIGEVNRTWLHAAVPLAAEAQALRLEVDRLFPGHQAFIRPGLDEAPSES